MDVTLIIPARYRSSRFPGKPLVDLAGKSMIQRVWEICIQVVPVELVFVAVDDDRVEKHCLDIGIQTVMTSGDCLTGTDRVYDASRQIDAEVYINVQGDEPLLNPEDIRAVLEASRAHPKRVINAMCPITEESDYISSTVPKVVARPDGRLLYMSRGPIPSNKEHHFVTAMKQVCVYSFPKPALTAFASVSEKTPLEAQEDIEILRFLELGYDVHMIEVSQASIAVDTPSDVERVLKFLE